MDIMWGNDNLREHQSRDGGGRWRFRCATTFIIDYTQTNRTVIIIITNNNHQGNKKSSTGDNVVVTEMTEVAVYDIISSRQTLPLQFDVSYATYQFPKYFAGRTGTYKNRSFFQRLGNVRSVTFSGTKSTIQLTFSLFGWGIDG